MDTSVTHKDEEYKKRGWFYSVAIHIGLIILALLPLLTFPDPPPGQEGILVNLGLPDVGQGEENAPPASAPAEAVPEASAPEVAPEPEPEPEPTPAREEVKKPEPAPQKEVVKTEDPEAVALRKKQQEEARKKQEEEARRKAAVEAERKRQEEEARRQAEAEAERKRQEEEASKLKDLLSGGFKQGTGEGKGNTGTAGNQGDPGGDPDASRLEGISTGSGTVGGGLGGRGLVASPRVTDNSQDQGTVVVKVCVDSNGNVVSAEFTQRGSTATSARLKSKAVENAQQWKFSKSSIDKQCGTITYNFKVQ